MQNISSLALVLWQVLKKEDKSQLSLIKFWQFFNPISAPRQKFKKYGWYQYEESVCKFQPSIFKTERGDRE